MSRVWTWTIFGFWALSMGFLFREKVMPGLLQTYYPSYQTLLGHELVEEKYQMGIFILGQAKESRIGVSRTSIESLPAEAAGDPAFSIHNDTTIDLTAIGNTLGADLTIRTTTLIDTRYRVRSHDVLIKTGVGDFVMSGVVRDESTLDVQIQTPFRREPEKRSMYFDSGMTLSNGISPFLTMPRLRIGREWNIHQIDPMSVVFGNEVRTKPLLARVERVETIRIEGKDVETFVVSLKSDRYEATAWISEDGKVMQERVPFSTGVPLLMRRERWTEPGK